MFKIKILMLNNFQQKSSLITIEGNNLWNTVIIPLHSGSNFSKMCINIFGTILFDKFCAWKTINFFFVLFIQRTKNLKKTVIWNIKSQLHLNFTSNFCLQCFWSSLTLLTVFGYFLLFSFIKKILGKNVVIDLWHSSFKRKFVMRA